MILSKKARVKSVLNRQITDYYPIFISATPQFWQKALHTTSSSIQTKATWEYQVNLDLDIIQVGHPSFYPVRVLELPEGERYTDEFQRTHVIAGYYDNFTAPFPLSDNSKRDVRLIEQKWKTYNFPDPKDPKWFTALDEISELNQALENPPSVWGVINGPLEPTWQLMSDGWPEFFILARRKPELAKEIMARVTDYCIAAGQGMIEHGVDAIRIGDDYALNEGLMCSPKVWYDFIYPEHKRLVAGLKAEGGADFPVILHSDGNITEILDWLGEGGLDGLNPIQPDALDFEEVINHIGHRLSMTAAFDLRLLLKPFTPEVEQELRNETKRLFEIVNQFNQKNTQKTGFCIGPTHQIQPSSCVETFEAWVRITHELNKQNIGS